MDAAAVERLTELIRELEPQLIFTHAARDPFNPDHGVAYEATVRRASSRAAPVSRARSRRSRRPSCCSSSRISPSSAASCPTTFLDITPVWDKKVAAMEAMGAQGYLRQYYSERAEHRANHARRISGRSDIRYAEAFQREIPVVVDAL